MKYAIKRFISLEGDNVRVLVYGAGVIGSIYAGKLAAARIDVTILARGNRLEQLKQLGIRLKHIKSNQIETINSVKVIDELTSTDKYDYIFVPMRKDQVSEALPVLKNNISPNIVFMVNNPSGPEQWAKEVGTDRVMIAFPGAGGRREEGIVHYHIVNRIVQPTTIGELENPKSERLRLLAIILGRAGFKVGVSANIAAWQLTHVAMVTPMANSIYMDGGSNYTTAKNKEAISLMSSAIKEAFHFLKDSKMVIEPAKLRFFLICPDWLLNYFLSKLYSTKWAETVISNHTLAARPEMKLLADEFIQLAEQKNYSIPNYKRLASYI